MNVKIRNEEVNDKDKNAANMHDVDISELKTFM
jgi:hypothetical protein